MTPAKRKPIRIQRMNESELDAAITELQRRGFTLMDRGTSEYTISEIKYQQSSKTPYKARGRMMHKLCWAVLRKNE